MKIMFFFANESHAIGVDHTLNSSFVEGFDQMFMFNSRAQA